MTDTALAPQLVQRIATAHAACLAATRDALSHARTCGALLTEAKAALPHGAWTDWLGTHFPGSPRTAQAYMRVAERWPELEAKAQSSADLSLDGALRLLAAPVVDAVERFLASCEAIEWPSTAQDAVAYFPIFEALNHELHESYKAMQAAFAERFTRGERLAAQAATEEELREVQRIMADADRVIRATCRYRVMAERTCGLILAGMEATP